MLSSFLVFFFKNAAFAFFSFFSFPFGLLPFPGSLLFKAQPKDFQSLGKPRVTADPEALERMRCFAAKLCVTPDLFCITEGERGC